MTPHRQHRPRPGPRRRAGGRRGPRGPAVGAPGGRARASTSPSTAPRSSRPWRRKLRDFREHGGGTVVDSTGMFHGRDVRLLRGALAVDRRARRRVDRPGARRDCSAATSCTPQTNPPTPWPAEKFADLFAREVTEGMVVPRVERRGAAGLVATAATRHGHDRHRREPAARARPGPPSPPVSPVSFRFGADAVRRARGRPRRGAAGRPGRRRRLDRTDAATRRRQGRRARRLRRHRPRRHRGRTPYVTDAERVALVPSWSTPARRPGPALEQRDRRRSGTSPPTCPTATSLTVRPGAQAPGSPTTPIRRVLVDNPRDLLVDSALPKVSAACRA